MTDAVRDMVAWARSRIDHCRREEQKFGRANDLRQPPQALVEAWTERRALLAVLEQLGIEVTP